MSYLLLLALVLVIGFIAVLATRATAQRSSNSLFIIIGFVLLALGLFAQIALGLALDEMFAKLFYWARISTALTWLGIGTLYVFQSKAQWLRWLAIGLMVASISMLVLVGFTQMTEAQNWYSTARPIYAQIDDLLATNRPTRWGALAMNILGVGALLYSVFQSFTGSRSLLVSTLLFIAAMGFLLPIYLPLQTANALFYLIELLPLVLLFAGLELSRAAPAKRRGKSR